jgi:hypothetical protein
MSGSGAIGETGLGTLIIGGLPFDWWATIQSEWANSPIMLALIGSFAAAVDQTQNIDNFYDWLWNVDAAQNYGLDVWGRIVGVGRVLPVSTQTTYLGFAQMGPPGAAEFGQAPFYSGQTITGNYALQDDQFRTVIFAKALANICDGTIQGLNAILQLLFPGRGPCYVADGLNMTMQYVFGFVLTPVETSIVLNSGVLPRPAGVAASFVFV